MKYGIIAAGLGSRLAEEGFADFKPMVEVNGESILERLIRIFNANAAEGIYLILNNQEQHIAANIRASFPNIKVITKDTPSSVHSFYELIQAFEDLDELCLSTIDTIFQEEEFAAYIEMFQRETDLDALMAVSKFEDDESPLIVNVDSFSTNNVTAFTSSPQASDYYISGGLYCFRRKALTVAVASVENDVHRMRNFQQELIHNNLNVKAFEFSKIIDIDHVSDIEKAASFLVQKL